MPEERRPELAAALFRLLDDHGRGHLGSRELRHFARDLLGFEGNDADWAEVYGDLCQEYGCSPETGADRGQFSRMLQDRSGVAYCQDEVIAAYFSKLPGYGSPGPGGESLASGGLPAIPRNKGFPSLLDLPEKHRKGLEQPLRSPRARLLCFYGAADHFATWARRWVAGAPPWAEAAVYEAPGHGLREAEPLEGSLLEHEEDAWQWLRPLAEQHATGGAAEGAPLALLGHSLGCQLLTLLAARLRRELAVEAAAVYVLDRGPPDIRLWSDEGYELLKKKPLAFIKTFDPSTFEMLNSSKGTPLGDQLLQRMQRGYMLGYECPQQEAQHTFRCPITVFVCKHVFQIDAEFYKGGGSKEQREWQSQRSRLLQSKEGSFAQFDEPQFGLWRRWASKKSCKAPTGSSPDLLLTRGS